MHRSAVAEGADTFTDVRKRLKGSPQKVRRAEILLKADVRGPNWTDTNSGVEWQFQVRDARMKLNSLYPKLKS
tara:strand:- start:1884 stop:2102 length:219 start_codon:yes stop_codon:yes gene_type:complete